MPLKDWNLPKIRWIWYWSNLEKQKIDIVNAEVGVDNAEDLILDNDDIILDDEDEVEIIDDVDVLEGVSTEDPVRMYLKEIGKFRF